MAFANLCEPISEYKNISSHLYRYEKPMDRVNASNYLSFLSKEISQEIYKGYVSGSLNKDFFKTCLNEDKDAKLLDSISTAFKQNLLDDFSKSTVKPLRDLGSEYLSSPDLFIFQAKLKLPYKSDSKAGYYRISGAMYYMLPDIPHNEFKVIALHELLHKYDEKELYHSSGHYSDKAVMSRGWDLSQKYSSYSELNTVDRKFMSQYILNGLKRGFLAEFKAWAATYELYKKMRQSGEVNSVQWVDEILAQQGQQNYLDFIFDYYRERFVRPERKSLFAFELLQDSYDVVLKDLKSKDKCQLMDDLAVFIDGCR